MRVLATLIAMLASAAPAAAQEHVPVPAGPEVEGLVAALAAKDRDGAIGRIKGIFALMDRDRMVRTPAAFVDLVIGCPSKQIDAQVDKFLEFYTYRWDCPKGEYQALLGKDPESSYVEVMDPADAARLAQRAAAPPVQQMLPPMLEPESSEVRKARVERLAAAELAALKALESQLKAGRLTEASAVTVNANFTTGYRDYSQSTFISQMDGDGIAAANEQLSWMTMNLGKPTSAACEQKRIEISSAEATFFSSCTVKTERPGHGYTALVAFQGSKIASIQFNYMNRDVFEKNRAFLTSNAGAN